MRHQKSTTHKRRMIVNENMKRLRKIFGCHSENDSCSHLEIACVRESVRTWDMGKGESYSHP